MKLIKKGDLLNKKYFAKCKKCGAVWEAVYCELKFSFDRGGEECVQAEICAECETYGLRFECLNIS